MGEINTRGLKLSRGMLTHSPMLAGIKRLLLSLPRPSLTILDAAGATEVVIARTVCVKLARIERKR